MAIDFTAIVSKVRRESEAQAKIIADAYGEERRKRRESIEAGVVSLRNLIKPLLEDAKKAFALEGIPAEITELFDFVGYVSRQPSIRLRCVGPCITNRHGGQSEPKSIAVFFVATGSAVQIRYGQQNESNFPEQRTVVVDPANLEAAVAEAIAKTLESYFMEIDDLRSLGLWE